VESFFIHRKHLPARSSDYDPLVLARIEGGSKILAADYLAMLHGRAALVRAMDARLVDLDGLILPTAAIVPPTIAEVSTSQGFNTKNALALRNTATVNNSDLCAISLPLPREGDLPVGLMIVARNGHDHKLFRMAAAVERLFSA
jgi:aspartyl-tRNA(Asn)/glutamyl-tRNA(Gln) amidotransferase subunit A